uniref:Uncharacterized protein n=1 Tax=Romanomermis culicivorax TaxID=13658 RepID=A0A915HH55_ROMCU
MTSNVGQGNINSNEHLQQTTELLIQPFVDLLSPDVLQEFDEFCSCTSKLSVDFTNSADISLELSNIIEENIELKSILDQIEFINDFVESSSKNLLEQTQEFRNAALNQQFDEFSNFLRQKISETRFLEQKSTKYRTEFAKLNDEMRKRGVSTIASDEKLLDSHWSILDQLRKDDEMIEKLRENLKRLERKQAGFFDLPTDIHLAKVKVEEKRLELENLEKELDAMIIDISRDTKWQDFNGSPTTSHHITGRLITINTSHKTEIDKFNGYSKQPFASRFAFFQTFGASQIDQGQSSVTIDARHFIVTFDA